MKMPDIIGSILHKPKEHQDVYLSLYLDVHTIAVSFWSLGASGHPQVLASEHAQDVKDTWDEKGEVIDRLVGMLEEKTKITDVTKVILGLPSSYIGENGDIRKEIRKEIKNLTRILELEPIGFVPLAQALIYKLKKEEGVPPSVILLGITDTTIAVSLYKIGVLAGVRDIEKTNDIASHVEEGLKSFTDLEVLPARMLLFGSDTSHLEEIKSDLLKHQWTSTVNFLHFPKIEIIEDAFFIDAISLAGASELAHTVEEISPDGEETGAKEEVSGEGSDEEIEEESEVQGEEKVTQDVIAAQEIIEEDMSGSKEGGEDANVVMVDAQSLGFQKDVDVLEERKQVEEAQKANEEEDERIEDIGKPKFSFALPAINISRIFSPVLLIFHRLRGQRSSKFVPIVIILVLLILCGAAYWMLPRAVVTILEIPQSINISEPIVIDPTATIVDAQNKIVPGRKREKSISGEKTVPVVGKKNVGDPARGTVTIYNKSLFTRSFKKGAVLTTESLQFTLDADIDVASASETIGSITFGKGNVNVTASAIGTASNIASATEFTFNNVSSTGAIARNDNAFTGGTSREVTVVTRADYDAFVKTMSEELVGRAKEELSTSVEGNDKLIDGTIKTSVTEKVFGQEIDQETTQLQGKLTITVSGIAYSESDVRAFLTTLAGNTLPQGYVINDAKTTVTVLNIQIKKDGKINAIARMEAIALPTMDIAGIRSSLAGKSLKSAEEILRKIPGIAGVAVSFQYSPTQNRLPVNKNNITITVSE